MGDVQPTDRHIVVPDAAASAGRRRIDAVDAAIIDALVADGRMSLTDLADRVNTSRSTAHTRIQRLREEGIITGFRAVVDPTAIGLGIAALVFVDIEQHDWRALRDDLMAIEGVEYLAMCAGEFDMMLLVRAASIAAFRDVLLQQIQDLAGVRSTETVFILDEVTR
jgi:DNA-binding Lrp family transcriptional regulator